MLDWESVRTSKLKATALLVIMTIVAVAALSTFYFVHSARGGAAVARFFADPLAVFAARSPGKRGEGVLLQTKPGYVRPRIHNGDVAASKPSERVLTNVRFRPPTAPWEDVPPFNVPQITDGPLVPGEDSPLKPGLNLPFSGSNFDGGDGIGGGGSNIGGGGGGIGTGPEPSAVPEPATWAMMIVGFFSAGVALRRRRRLKMMTSPRMVEADQV